jgi:hypothetical protein
MARAPDRTEQEIWNDVTGISFGSRRKSRVDYCTARAFDLFHDYVDVGQSGAKDSRPEPNKLMDDACDRQFDAIVVWRFDRFAGSTKHILSALEEFRSLGIQFISYLENIDTRSGLLLKIRGHAQLEALPPLREPQGLPPRNAMAQQVLMFLDLSHNHEYRGGALSRSTSGGLPSLTSE